MAELNVTLQVGVFSSDIALHVHTNVFLVPSLRLHTSSLSLLFVSVYLPLFVCVSFLSNYFGYEKRNY